MPLVFGWRSAMVKVTAAIFRAKVRRSMLGRIPFVSNAR